jgi:DNA polymerase-3 subunit alpha
MQDHGLDQDRVVLPLLNRLAGETGIPLVVTNDSHYLRKDDALAQEVLVCINTGKTLSDGARMKFSTPDFYMKSREEMMTLFGEVEHALDRTWEIAQRCQVKLEKVKEPFPEVRRAAAHTLDSYFAYVTQQGFEHRRVRLEAQAQAGRLKHPLETYVKRLEDEIRMIQQMKFSGYFLIVWDFIRHAKSRGIPVGPGAVRRRGVWLRSPRHYRYRSARVRSAVRALPQSRAHFDA